MYKYFNTHTHTLTYADSWLTSSLNSYSILEWFQYSCVKTHLCFQGKLLTGSIMQVVLRSVPQCQVICFNSISFLLKELQGFLLAMLLQTRQVTPFKRDNPSNDSDWALLERTEVWAEEETEILRGNSLSNLIMSKLARQLWYPSCCRWGICVTKAVSNLRQTNK